MKLTTTLLLGCGAAMATKTALDHDAERAEMIARTNAVPGILWKAGANEKFQGQPLGSEKSLCGVLPGTQDRLRKLAADGKVTVATRDPTVSLPTSFESETNWPKCAKVINDIRDQSNCGCCWAFGAAEAASDRLCIATNGTVAAPLSAQETCFCANPEGCNGGQLEVAWLYLQTNGLATGGQYNHTGYEGDAGLCASFSLPHCHHHGPQGNDPYPAEGAPGCPEVTDSPKCPRSCDASSKSPYNNFTGYRYQFTGSINTFQTDPDAIAQSIMAAGPVEAAFTVYADFANYVSGIYHATSTESLGGHAIKIVGWGEEAGVKYWKVANSWNEYWGENGYFRIVRGTNECGIEDSVVASADTTDWQGPGITPVPPPPPTPGNCDDQTTQAACIRTSTGGQRCEWCVLKGLGIAVCQDPGQPCN